MIEFSDLLDALRRIPPPPFSDEINEEIILRVMNGRKKSGMDVTIKEDLKKMFDYVGTSIFDVVCTYLILSEQIAVSVGDDGELLFHSIKLPLDSEEKGKPNE
jgi:hypothetical protein